VSPGATELAEQVAELTSFVRRVGVG